MRRPAVAASISFRMGRTQEGGADVLMSAPPFVPDGAGPPFCCTPDIERPIMHTSDLVDLIATATGNTKSDARRLVDLVLRSIVDAAAKGHDVSLNGFGKFKVKASPAREGRSPATGETLQIAASRKLTFSAAKAVKDRLNG